jgi:hypothetical protein
MVVIFAVVAWSLLSLSNDTFQWLLNLNIKPITFKAKPRFKFVDVVFTAKISINFLVLLKMTLK